jgi:hypothetical protein
MKSPSMKSPNTYRRFTHDGCCIMTCDMMLNIIARINWMCDAGKGKNMLDTPRSVFDSDSAHQWHQQTYLDRNIFEELRRQGVRKCAKRLHTRLL